MTPKADAISSRNSPGAEDEQDGDQREDEAVGDAVLFRLKTAMPTEISGGGDMLTIRQKAREFIRRGALAARAKQLGLGGTNTPNTVGTTNDPALKFGVQ